MVATPKSGEGAPGDDRESDEAAFVAELLPDAPAATRAAIMELVKRASAAAASAWPGVCFPPFDVLVRRALDRLGPEVDPAVEMGRLYLSDLFLACACATGEPRAIRHVEERFLSRIDRFLRKIDSSDTFADEVRRQIVREKLFLGGESLQPKIVEYTGAGPFDGWLRVVAIRSAQNLVRARRPPADPRVAVLPLQAASRDPELALARTQYGVAFRACFEEAMAELPAEDRTFLRLHYIDGMSSEATAKMYRMGSATVRRRIATARQRLLKTTRRLLTERLQVPLVDLDGLLAELQSGFDLSLSRLLRSSARPT